MSHFEWVRWTMYMSSIGSEIDENLWTSSNCSSKEIIRVFVQLQILHDLSSLCSLVSRCGFPFVICFGRMWLWNGILSRTCLQKIDEFYLGSSSLTASYLPWTSYNDVLSWSCSTCQRDHIVGFCTWTFSKPCGLKQLWHHWALSPVDP